MLLRFYVDDIFLQWVIHCMDTGRMNEFATLVVGMVNVIQTGLKLVINFKKSNNLVI